MWRFIYVVAKSNAGGTAMCFQECPTFAECFRWYFVLPWTVSIKWSSVQEYPGLVYLECVKCVPRLNGLASAFGFYYLPYIVNLVACHENHTKSPHAEADSQKDTREITWTEFRAKINLSRFSHFRAEFIAFIIRSLVSKTEWMPLQNSIDSHGIENPWNY